MARLAAWAGQARIVGFDDDTLTDFAIVNLVADRDDVAAAFMAQHPRQPWGGAGAFEDAEIRTAQPHTADRNNDIVRARYRLGPVLDQIYAARRRKDDGFHRHGAGTARGPSASSLMAEDANVNGNCATMSCHSVATTLHRGDPAPTSSTV